MTVRFGGPRPPPRLLAALDYSAQPYNLGDFLIYQTGMMVAARDAGANRIDLCVVSDPNRPPVDPIMAKLITPDNHRERLHGILPLAQLNPMIGAVHVFDDHAEFRAFFERAGEGVQRWPSPEDLEAGKYLFYDVFKAVHRHHARHGAIPALRFSAEQRSRALDFLARAAGGRVPVTVNLRANPGFHAHRNSILPAWRDFFRDCAARHPVAFVVTCAASEVDADLRALPHVVFSKDHHVDLLGDLALIQHAAFHVGAASGPAAVPIFGAAPYHIVHCDMRPHLALYEGSLLETAEGELRYAFAAPHQTFGVTEETAEDLGEHFERIWGARDWPAAWAERVRGEGAGGGPWS